MLKESIPLTGDHISDTEALLARAMKDAGALTEGGVFLITLDVETFPPPPQPMIIVASAMQAAKAVIECD